MRDSKNESRSNAPRRTAFLGGRIQWKSQNDINQLRWSEAKALNHLEALLSLLTNWLAKRKPYMESSRPIRAFRETFLDRQV